MASCSFGKSRRAFCVVASITFSSDTPLILLMYSAEMEIFFGSFLTCIETQKEETREDKSGLIKQKAIKVSDLWTMQEILSVSIKMSIKGKNEHNKFTTGKCTWFNF